MYKNIQTVHTIPISSHRIKSMQTGANCYYFTNYIKEAIIMNTNLSIACSVNECKHHANSENYCTLDKINVAKCDCNTRKCEDTECGSFQAK